MQANWRQAAWRQLAFLREAPWRRPPCCHLVIGHSTRKLFSLQNLHDQLRGNELNRLVHHVAENLHRTTATQAIAFLGGNDFDALDSLKIIRKRSTTVMVGSPLLRIFRRLISRWRLFCAFFGANRLGQDRRRYVGIRTEGHRQLTKLLQVQFLASTRIKNTRQLVHPNIQPLDRHFKSCNVLLQLPTRLRQCCILARQRFIRLLQCFGKLLQLRGLLLHPKKKISNAVMVTRSH
jgi:hypothetical protein